MHALAKVLLRVLLSSSWPPSLACCLFLPSSWVYQPFPHFPDPCIMAVAGHKTVFAQASAKLQWQSSLVYFEPTAWRRWESVRWCVRDLSLCSSVKYWKVWGCRLIYHSYLSCQGHWSAGNAYPPQGLLFFLEKQGKQKNKSLASRRKEKKKTQAGCVQLNC